MEINIGGSIVLIDDEDFDKVSEYTWHIYHRTRALSYARTTANIDGRKTGIRMHRLILGVLFDRTYDVDHINHNGLDNRKSNLRLVTASENMKNMRLSGGASGYPWVYKVSGYNKWRTIIDCKHIGYSSCPTAAYLKALKYRHDSVKRNGSAFAKPGGGTE